MIECMGIIGIKVKFDFKALFSKPRSKVSALQISTRKSPNPYPRKTAGLETGIMDAGDISRLNSAVLGAK